MSGSGQNEKVSQRAFLDRCTPESGRGFDRYERQLRASSGLMHCSKAASLDHLVGTLLEEPRHVEVECFCGLRLTTNSNLVGACTGRSVGSGSAASAHNLRSTSVCQQHQIELARRVAAGERGTRVMAGAQYGGPWRPCCLPLRPARLTGIGCTPRGSGGSVPKIVAPAPQLERGSLRVLPTYR
jgi:hypothetical protein